MCGDPPIPNPKSKGYRLQAQKYQVLELQALEILWYLSRVPTSVAKKKKKEREVEHGIVL